ncbi:MAG TPA: lysophospholipid acyltransferase family protein [Roseiarcus sp.]|nr:lysophospholipid acyltransferase family protein [Roseiarcus sp.]
MIALRSALFNIAYYINLVVLMILGLPSMLFGRRGVFFMARAWAASSIWLLEKICGLKVEFRGLENRPQGGYILAAKHQSSLETFSLVTKTPDFAIVLKKQLMYIPIFGLYLSVSGQIGIDRAKGRSALAQIIEQAGAVLRAGRQVYIYPEGTRRPPGAEPAYKPGVALLYEATGAPCLPVALNTGMFWGRNGFLRRPGTAVIEFLPAIPAGLPRDMFFERLQEAIETASRRLMEEALAERAALDPRPARP